MQDVRNEELRVEKGVGGIVVVERNSTVNGKLDIRFERIQIADILKGARRYNEKIGDIYGEAHEN